MLKFILFVVLVANVLFLVSSTVCGPYEVYSKCINGGCIGARNCSELGIPIRCVKIDPNDCKGGCLCKTGYLRNNNGNCIPEDKCCGCKEHEHYSNCTNGGCYGARHCYEKGKPVKCYKVCAKDCIKGCLCDKRYLRHKNGTCIPEKKCPPKCTKPNEVYEECPAKCPYRTCGIDDRLIRCGTQPEVGDPDCPPPGCRCASGYFRHPNGDCVKWEQCPRTGCGGDPNAVPITGCGSGCRRSCSNYKQKDLICPAVCRTGCDCKPDYVYDDKQQKCVLPSKCTRTGCGGDPNAVPITGCGSGCRRSCSNYKQKNLLCPAVCRTGCDCKPNYVYDYNKKKCVLPSECTPVCGLNEVFSDCTQGVCRNQYCSQKGQPVACPGLTPGSCTQGCVCQENYLRANNGTCIPEEQCPTKCNQPHEYYEPCPKHPELTCDCIKKPYSDAKAANSTVCHGECRCEPGFFRNLIGECISKNQCLQCPGPHQYFSCGGACDNVCKDLSKKNQTNCPIINIQCNKMCYCEKGYARNARNICVPFKDCEPECKGQNEEYSICANGGCSKGLKCTDLGGLIICIDPVECKGGCICKNGYHRNDQDVCISEKDCRGNCSSTEIFSNCTLGHCRNELCSQKKNPIACPAIPYPCEKGCVCQKYHLRAPNSTCVPEDKCPPEPPVCGNNEVYSECTQGVCRPQVCSQKGKPVPCPDIKPGTCKTGCICKEKYLRDKSGKCIPEDQCTEKCGLNEYYDECPPCSTQSCDKNLQIKCSQTDVCRPACRCKKGYLRNKKGICVLEKECDDNCGE